MRETRQQNSFEETPAARGSSGNGSQRRSDIQAKAAGADGKLGAMQMKRSLWKLMADQRAGQVDDAGKRYPENGRRREHQHPAGGKRREAGRGVAGHAAIITVRLPVSSA